MHKYSSDGRKCGIRGRRKRQPNICEPGTYKVCFIDGHDLKYKTFTCDARNRKEAIGKMFDLFGPSFDHQIKDVYRRDDENETFVEC